MENYYVMEITAFDGIGYTSIHRTGEGAAEKMVKVANDWGIRVNDWRELDGCPDIKSYGISYLPVEE